MASVNNMLSGCSSPLLTMFSSVQGKSYWVGMLNFLNLLGSSSEQGKSKCVGNLPHFGSTLRLMIFSHAD